MRKLLRCLIVRPTQEPELAELEVDAEGFNASDDIARIIGADKADDVVCEHLTDEAWLYSLRVLQDCPHDIKPNRHINGRLYLGNLVIVGVDVDYALDSDEIHGYNEISLSDEQIKIFSSILATRNCDRLVEGINLCASVRDRQVIEQHTGIWRIQVVVNVNCEFNGYRIKPEYCYIAALLGDNFTEIEYYNDTIILIADKSDDTKEEFPDIMKDLRPYAKSNFIICRRTKEHGLVGLNDYDVEYFVFRNRKRTLKDKDAIPAMAVLPSFPVTFPLALPASSVVPVESD